MQNTLKNQKGITLAALTVYIIIFTMLIGVMTTVSTFFYGSISKVLDTPKYVSEFNKFTMFFAVDAKNYNNATVTSNSIQFENGPKYEYRDNHIYRNGVAIAEYMMDCKFELNQYNVNTTSKNIINVKMQIGKDSAKSVKKDIDFTLKYW